MQGPLVDPDAVENGVPLPITEMAIERDAFCGEWLAISGSMGTEEAAWAGIYVTKIRASVLTSAI